MHGELGARSRIEKEVNVEEVKKYDILQDIISELEPGTVAVETGRIRSKRQNEGHSTRWLAESKNVDILYSIDHNPMTQLVCQEIIDKEYLDKIRFVNADSEQALRTIESILADKLINFLFLDSANDPVITVREFLAIRPALTSNCIIVIDDVYSEFGFKGELLIPKLQEYGYDIESREPYAIIRCGQRV